MAQSIVSREELLENAYQIAERKPGCRRLSVRGLANATGVSVGTVYRHFSAKDELTTATIQLYFKHAFYERFCHIDPQVGFVDYCREMHASMREVTTHFRECWLRGIDALPAVEKGRRPPARVPANRAHPPWPHANLRARRPDLGRFARRVRCRKRVQVRHRERHGQPPSPKRQLQSAVWPARKHVVCKQRTVARGNEHHAFDVHTAGLQYEWCQSERPIGRCPQIHSILEV